MNPSHRDMPKLWVELRPTVAGDPNVYEAGIEYPTGRYYGAVGPSIGETLIRLANHIRKHERE